MTVGILTEKPSASRNFAKALGGHKGKFNGEDYVITAARGHLYGLKEPHEMVSADKAGKYKQWDIAQLPWDINDFDFSRKPLPSTRDTIKAIKSALSGVDEIVIATDVDPSGEGELLAWEILDELGLHHKKITRMFFTDEAEASIQKSFKARKSIASMHDDGDFRKADYRAKFDLMSMQCTRSASAIADQAGRRVVLRNGRLKSAMVVLVGDQLKAHNEYKREPKYQARFRDDHNVLYVNKNADKFENESDVPIGDFHTSDVEHVDSKKKKQPPPKLLDLSGLSTILAKRGMKPKKVLSVYQQMYEDQVVSYPRTEDRVVTPEQFAELEPKIDAIAAVAGIDPAKLTHRSPRKTHVKAGGAHGANRPGPNVPSSLSAVKGKYGDVGAAIYEVLAKNYLTMLGEDYEYTQHNGRVKDFPSFTGSINEPTQLGWKAIFDSEAQRKDDDADGDDDEANKQHTTLGSTADPFVDEIVPPRPIKPTMDWLMKRLEHYDVGTGATRTSTFAEVTAEKSAKNKFPLMAEKSGKITLQPAGEINYQLLPGTTIGDLALTKQVYANMDAIAAGDMNVIDALATMAEWIVKDIEIMGHNATNIDDSLGAEFAAKPAKPKYAGYHAPTGEEKTFSKQWAGYTLSDDECEALLRGENVTVEHSLNDSPVKITFTLGDQSFTNDAGEKITYFGVNGTMQRDVSNDPNYFEGTYAPTGEVRQFKRSWGGYRLNDEECTQLLEGKTITVKAKLTYGLAKVKFSLGDQFFTDKDGKTVEYFGLNGEIDDSATHARGTFAPNGKEVKFKRTWGGHDFTEAEIADLLAGKEIQFAAKSKANKDYTAKGKLEEQEFNGRKFFGFKLDFDGDKKKRK